MQQQPENDLIYLLTTLEAAEKISIYRSPFSNASDFFLSNDQLHFNATLLLIATIGELVRKELKASTFSLEELEVARNSSWYRHIDFDSLT